MFGFNTEKRKKTGERRQQTDLALDLNSLEPREAAWFIECITSSIPK